MNKKISLTLIFIVVLSLCIAIVSAKYATISPIVVDNLNLTIGTPSGYVPGEEYEPLKNGSTAEGYHILYICYNGEKNVIAKEEIYQCYTDVITIAGEIEANNAFYGGEFLGWSLNGIFSTNNNNMVPLYNQNRATIASLMANYGILRLLTSEAGLDLTGLYGEGVGPEYKFQDDTDDTIDSEGESSTTTDEEGLTGHIYIMLYDIYASSPILTIKPHSSETFANSNDYVLVEPHVWFFPELMEDIHNEEDNKTSDSSGSSSSGTTIDINLLGAGFGKGYCHVPYMKGTYFYYTEQDAREEATENGVFNQEEYEKNMKNAGFGMYLPRERYKLTSVDDKVDFFVHTGLGVSSGGNANAGNYVDSESNKKDFYLALFESEDTEIDISTDVKDITKNRCRGITVVNNETLYAADTIPSGYVPTPDSSTSIIACFSTGTLITLANGSKIPVEQLTDKHILRVYDHENGSYSYAPPLLINYDGDKLYKIARLLFDDGEKLEIINERGLFDITLNQYVYITPDNCTQFIGHKFAKEMTSGVGAVELVNAYKTTKFTGCYSVTSTYYINHFINGYLTVPGGIHWFVNYFEYGENLKYNEDSMNEDLAKYGECTLEEILTYLPKDLVSKFSKEELELMFNKLYPAKYLKVTVGKGLANISDIIKVINDWIIYYDLSGKL